MMQTTITKKKDVQTLNVLIHTQIKLIIFLNKILFQFSWNIFGSYHTNVPVDFDVLMLLIVHKKSAVI